MHTGGNGAPMRIAVAAPLALADLGDLLTDELPEIRAVGGGTPITHLVRGLVGRGHEVVVVTGDIGRRTETVLGGPGLRVHVGPYRAQHFARDGFAAERAYFARTLEAVRPDLVHAHWTYEFALGALATTLPVIVTVHDWAPTILRYFTDPYRTVRLLMNAVTMARAPHLTVASPTMQARVRRWARRQATLVPNAIADADFAPREVALAPRPPRARPRVVSINNGFSRLKNVTTLLQAWPMVVRRFPQAELELIGSGFGAGEPAHGWAAERGLATNVTFTGQLSNAAAMDRLETADLMVHPSREESFGLVILEAMARGVPVVGGDRAGAVPWLLDSGRAGILTDVTDARDLARAVLRSLADPAETALRRQHAYDRSWERFRLTRALDGFEALYDAVATTR